MNRYGQLAHDLSRNHRPVAYSQIPDPDRFFEMGRYLQYPNAVSSNRLWNALIGAMEASGAGTFGDPMFDNTPLDHVLKFPER